MDPNGFLEQLRKLVSQQDMLIGRISRLLDKQLSKLTKKEEEEMKKNI